VKPIILDNFGQWEETLALMEQKTGLSLAEIARAAFLEKAKHFREQGFIRFGPGSTSTNPPIVIPKPKDILDYIVLGTSLHDPAAKVVLSLLEKEGPMIFNRKTPVGQLLGEDTVLPDMASAEKCAVLIDEVDATQYRWKYEPTPEGVRLQIAQDAAEASPIDAGDSQAGKESA